MLTTKSSNDEEEVINQEALLIAGVNRELLSINESDFRTLGHIARRAKLKFWLFEENAKENERGADKVDVKFFFPQFRWFRSAN